MIKFLKIILFYSISILILLNPSFACLGPETERAREEDATVLFVGELISYELNPAKGYEGLTSGMIAKLNFKVQKTLQGKEQVEWSVLMRGHTLPVDKDQFIKRFGKVLKVGLRDFSKKIDLKKLPENFRNPFFIVDAACSMNEEDWLLRPVSEPKE